MKKPMPQPIVEAVIEPAIEPVEAPAPPAPKRFTRQDAFDACDAFVRDLEALVATSLAGDDPVLIDARREAGRMANAFGYDLSRLYGYVPISGRPNL